MSDNDKLTRSGPASDSSEITERAARETRSAVSYGTEAAREAKHETAAMAGEVKARLADTAEEQKGALTAMISDVAQAVQTAAGQLGEKHQDGAAEYARTIGSGLSSIARTLDHKSANDIVGDVTQFARTHPTAYLGGALLIGMALARFAKASEPSGQTATGPRGAGTSPAVRS